MNEKSRATKDIMYWYIISLLLLLSLLSLLLLSLLLLLLLLLLLFSVYVCLLIHVDTLSLLYKLQKSIKIFQ